MSVADRRSPNNGLWMCRAHGWIIDSNDPKYTTGLLHEWKREAEQHSWQRLVNPNYSAVSIAEPASDTAKRLRQAAQKDLAVWRRTQKWPATSVSLALRIDGLDSPLTSKNLAVAVTNLEDLIIVAAPGMGKTTTLFQIADSLLEEDYSTPLLVLLGDWATQNSTIMESILQRMAFTGVSQTDVHSATVESGVVLLLDGWNELDSKARRRAHIQISELKAELPELGIVISTRKQAQDVPITGKKAELLELNSTQQMQIARAIGGDAGAQILDQAWRTNNVRELVANPLYLTALLSLPADLPIPTNKEEVLGAFVAAHERQVAPAAALADGLKNLQKFYLSDLAWFATKGAKTSLSESEARRTITTTASKLITEGQIAQIPEPADVVELLVDSHLLVRDDDNVSISFQHQQFQEWYASNYVEHLMMSGSSSEMLPELKHDVLDFPEWEEAVLFATERLSRGDELQQRACADAVLAAFDVDPMLAAEMIFRCAGQVWDQISKHIQDIVCAWHIPGRVDRALRFMLTSGRFEFLDTVWPLITNEDLQISLEAIRNCNQFRASILGNDFERKIEEISQSAKQVLLSEIASSSGMDGMDLATNIACRSNDHALQKSIIDSLLFRHADRHVVQLLRAADDKFVDLVVAEGWIGQLDDQEASSRIESSVSRIAQLEKSGLERLELIARSDFAQENESALTEIVFDMKIQSGPQQGIHFILELANRYQSAIVDALVARVRAGRLLFYGADNLMAAANYCLEDHELLQLALDFSSDSEDNANAAATVLGPGMVGEMIQSFLELSSSSADPRTSSQTLHSFQDRISRVPFSSLISAVLDRSGSLESTQIGALASLLSRTLNLNSEKSHSIEDEAIGQVQNLIRDWGEQLLVSSDANRSQKARIANLAAHAPSASLIPILSKLLGDNLERLRKFRKEAEASDWQAQPAVNEASWPMTSEYQHAFEAIDSIETTTLMFDYLEDLEFGEYAARVLAAQWKAKNTTPSKSLFPLHNDFGQIEKTRALQNANPGGTTAEGEALFTTIERLIAEDLTQDQKLHATKLGAVAVNLPHGERSATIEKLISITPLSTRYVLLLNLVLSGSVVDSSHVADGILATLTEAETKPWLLHQSDGYALSRWLELLPFTNQPKDSLAVIKKLPDAQRTPSFLRDFVNALAKSPATEEREEIFFALAKDDPRWYQNRQWLRATSKTCSLTAWEQLLSLYFDGKLEIGSDNQWLFAQELGRAMEDSPSIRKLAYNYLENHNENSNLSLVAKAISENPDVEGLLRLVHFASKNRIAIPGRRVLEKLVTEHVLVHEENRGGAYHVVPTGSAELRKSLLGLTRMRLTKEVAVQCLTAIDVIRDEYGMPISEPRHPDIESGVRWPIIESDLTNTIMK
jgi:hypothetical protein